MDDNLYKEMVFEDLRKSKKVAYLLWLFTGWFGVHRFYSGRTKSGAIQLAMTVLVVGFPIVLLWWLIDFFLVPDMVNEQNRKTLSLINSSNTSPQGEAPGPQQIEGEMRAPEPELDPKREAMLEDLRQTGYRKPRRDNFSSLYR